MKETRCLRSLKRLDSALVAALRTPEPTVLQRALRVEDVLRAPLPETVSAIRAGLSARQMLHAAQFADVLIRHNPPPRWAEQAARVLTDALDHGTRGVRRIAAAALALRQHGDSDSAVATLARALSDPDLDVRVGAARGLAGTTNQAALTALDLALQKDDDRRLRRAAARALQQSASRRAAFILKRYGADKDWQVRRAAGAPEGPDNSERDRESVLIGLTSPDAGVCGAALDRAAGLADKAVRHAVVRALQHRNPGIRQAAAAVLRGVTDVGVLDQLCEMLVGPPDKHIKAAADALAGTHDATAVRVLAHVLRRHKRAHIRRQAALSLAGSTHDAAVSALVDALRAPDRGVQKVAAEGLGGADPHVARRWPQYARAAYARCVPVGRVCLFGIRSDCVPYSLVETASLIDPVASQTPRAIVWPPPGNVKTRRRRRR